MLLGLSVEDDEVCDASLIPRDVHSTILGQRLRKVCLPPRQVLTLVESFILPEK